MLCPTSCLEQGSLASCVPNQGVLPESDVLAGVYTLRRNTHTHTSRVAIKLTQHRQLCFQLRFPSKARGKITDNYASTNNNL